LISKKRRISSGLTRWQLHLTGFYAELHNE
jgi:hypothetical protein